jgi:hypothetical protein
MSTSIVFGIETGLASDIYNVALAAHILLSIAGFGAVMLNGVYITKARRLLGPQGRAVAEANYSVSAIAEVLILLVPVSGLALVWASDGSWNLSTTWLSVSSATFVVAFVISRAVLMPGHRRIIQLLDDLATGSGDEKATLSTLDRSLRNNGIAGATLNLLLIVIVALMIWKPGN